ncbi:MAG TPA: ATP-binding protein [Armatimonadota bacterium]
MPASAAMLDSLIAHVPVSMQVLDKDGLTVRVNDAYLALFGYGTRQEVEGKHNPRTHASIRAQGLDQYIERAFAGELVHTPTAPFLPLRAGSAAPGEIRATLIPIFDDAGAVENVIIVHEDLKALSTSERAWKRRDKLMSGLQAAYRLITDCLQVGAVIEAVLDAAQEVLGADKAAIWAGGRDDDWDALAQRGLSPSFQEDLRSVRERSPALQAVARGIKDSNEAWAYHMTHPVLHCPEFDRLLAGEGIRRVLVVPLRSRDVVSGTLTQYFSDDAEFEATHIEAACLLADLAAAAMHNAFLFEQLTAIRDELEERAQATTEDLRLAHEEAVLNEKLAAVGYLAKEVAHGLRNPLNVISASSYYLHSRCPGGDEKIERHFEAIGRSIGQAADMITDLTALAGGSKPEVVRLDITELAHRAVQERLTSVRVPVETDWAAELPPTRGDWAQLLQAMRSLLANAAAARRERPVYVGTSRDDGFVEFSVGDDREDLAEEEIGSAFGTFSSSATQWTGLSLTVARQIAKRHEGNVVVDRANGVTWFRMRLPVDDGAGS